MRTSRILLFAGLFVAGSALLLPSHLAAQRTLVIERFDAEVQVEPNGDVQVTETIRSRFRGSWNGIYRNLSLAHQTADGRSARLDVELISVTDQAGEELEYEVSNEGRWTRRFQVWIPGAEDATRTVVLRYVIHNVIRFFEEGSEAGPLDELYWNVTGNEWEVPIEGAGARVTLPDGVSATQSAGYTGSAGSTETAVRIASRGNSVSFDATRTLGPGEGLTVAVGWPPGAVARPSPASYLSQQAGRWGPLALPFLAFLLAFRQWSRKGKDPEARAIAVHYEPPEGLCPAEVGTLVDNKAQMHDITSTLVDLAVRGFVHIQQIEEKKMGVFSNKEYVFHLKKPRDDWDSLNTHEERYLRALFDRAEPGTFNDLGEEAGEGPAFGSVKLSELKNRFYKELNGIRKAVYEQLVSKGHYDRNPEEVKGGWIVGGAGLMMLAVIGGFWINGSASFPLLDPITLGVALGLSGLVFLIFGQLMPARTVQGARAREWALGFKEFLGRVEEPRYKKMITSPQMFEQFLAYAMAFKVESKWSEAFEDMYREPPGWYSGPHRTGFRSTIFIHDLSAMSTAASNTMSSSPSGSSGGGSSGGGSGGGGGGGF